MDINKFIYGYETRFKEGFTPEEVKEILDKLKDEMNMEKWDDAMMCNTCINKEGIPLTFHSDLTTGLRCGIENRDIHWWEFD